MYPRRLSTTLCLVALVLLVGFLAGCGGGDQSGSGSQNGGPDGAKKLSGEDAQRGAGGAKIALGTVRAVDSEAGIIILRPSSEVQGEKPLRFKLNENTTLTLDNKQAEMADIEQGQQAQITYVVKHERNLARQVALISRGGDAAG
jgi:hypothetical protein